MAESTGIEINVVDWNNGKREVCVHFKALGQMVSLNAEGARAMAFCLTECADFIEPPFADAQSEEEDEESFFGDYDSEEDEE